MEQLAEQTTTGHETPDMIVGDTPEETQTVEFEPLFEDERGHTEAQLRGEDVEAEGTRIEAESKKAGETPATSVTVSETGKVPEGQPSPEQQTIAQLQGEILRLNQALAQEQSYGSEGTDGEAFKVLSDEEFEELAEDDPTEATIYLKRLDDHKAKQKEIEAQLQHENSVIAQSWREMSEGVEGFADPKSTVRKDLTDFALKDLGFSNDDLIALTSPGTLVKAPGDKSVRILGQGAAAAVKMVNRLYQAASKKTTQSPSQPGTTKADKIAGSPSTVSKKGFSEQQYASMTREQREAALGG